MKKKVAVFISIVLAVAISAALIVLVIFFKSTVSMNDFEKYCNDKSNYDTEDFYKIRDTGKTDYFFLVSKQATTSTTQELFAFSEKNSAQSMLLRDTFA